MTALLVQRRHRLEIIAFDRHIRSAIIRGSHAELGNQSQNSRTNNACETPGIAFSGEGYTT
jgi:hypothetical protein